MFVGYDVVQPTCLGNITAVFHGIRLLERFKLVAHSPPIFGSHNSVVGAFLCGLVLFEYAGKVTDFHFIHRH